ncbi:MAG: hypothetical protein Q8P25_00470 [Candidatus Curtissbacteria bacterium]|nr:hypothetical protein [Candidatus Curtissbacteria bacterium]
MSKVFYDHLIILEEVKTELTSSEISSADKKEIDQMIEESVHFRVITKILDHLPREHHKKFLESFHQAPHSENVLNFLKEKVSDIENIIKDEVSALGKELLKEIKSFKSK